MSKDLYGQWYVYRYNIDRHVLKAPATVLFIKEPPPSEDPKHTILARFELSGFDKPVHVVLDKADPGKAGEGHFGGDQEAKTVTWFGEQEGFDFRLTRHEGLRGILTGYTADRHLSLSRDTFVALRKERKIPLRPRNTYGFQHSYTTPLVRTRPSSKGDGASIILESANPKKANIITFEGERYRINLEESEPDNHRFSAETDDKVKKLRLWVLPTDESKSLVAIGYHFHHHEHDGDVVPVHPMCGIEVLVC